MFDYKLLQAFEAVIREGGFDKAAKSIHLTQSAVSQRVKLLEAHMGQVLLMRTTPPMPTPAGQRILKHFLQVKQLESDVTREMSPGSKENLVSLAIALNEDSLATWFLPCIAPFLSQHSVVLDLRVDDQDQTHQFLGDGQVLGCISSRSEAVQGCKISFLGIMDYRLVATPAFAKKWFPHGLDRERMDKVPAVIFNSRDKLHTTMLSKIFKEDHFHISSHFVPSSEQFAWAIASGFGYGMLPDQQSSEMLDKGTLVNLCPHEHVRVRLYWHRWNISSPMIEALTRCLEKGLSTNNFILDKL
ncbi:LysR family transcriptional regulator, chromosome initiation inhibitor [Desulfocicer vacuolatum DSM 3385]|uniref:LysR family transcriptional regulator, chromosome initiation inhibitor n=1 Tax=Desulfocicer vacuolatum DSM 3385 TaxID=1121400 RepID=A0A1W2E7P9_9BACT|nr:LysR family transcriptional regulator ArgP [Desulfocicer vacuolatum]SMD05685.1 LysR family transcriptional regulator, chromosome initiation inhibitor [Desulfocicer vacuolatum DSM 3385]